MANWAIEPEHDPSGAFAELLALVGSSPTQCTILKSFCKEISHQVRSYLYAIRALQYGEWSESVRFGKLGGVAGARIVDCN